MLGPKSSRIGVEGAHPECPVAHQLEGKLRQEADKPRASLVYMARLGSEANPPESLTDCQEEFSPWEGTVDFCFVEVT